VQQQRIDEQRDEGDRRQDLVDVRCAQQPPQPQPAVFRPPGLLLEN
jgi:hypothetical protein